VLYNQHMSIQERYPIKFICHYDAMDKVWGWILPPQYDDTKSPTYYGGARYQPKTAYAFWAVVGKIITVKTHQYYNKGSMHGLEKRKIANKYVEIPVEDLLARWPQFWEQLEQAVIFHKLSEG
jgi:hypothetical protein